MLPHFLVHLNLQELGLAKLSQIARLKKSRTRPIENQDSSDEADETKMNKEKEERNRESMRGRERERTIEVQRRLNGPKKANNLLIFHIMFCNSENTSKLSNTQY